jgi:hypothetical protein
LLHRFLFYLSANKGFDLKKIVLLTFFLFTLFTKAFAQNSCALRISLLTCAPGEELYSTFGHTAIRLIDSTAGVDEVYNYGTFEFSPDFYYQFVRGKLLYALSVEDFQSFLFQYQAESRSIIEQELALDCQQKQQLYTALRTNALPENRFYRYDFLFDNCTTRARDMIVQNSGGVVTYRPLFTNEQPTFRHLIHGYLNRANQDWSKFGIDLLLGAKLDRRATNQEAMFLPDNLMKAFDTAMVNNKQLIKEEEPLLIMPIVASESYLITPAVLFTFILLAIGVLAFVKKGWAKKVVQVFDFLLFFTLGGVGVLLLFMWFGTDHQLCANNYNLVWAPPTHLIAAFFLWKRQGWVKPYFRINFFVTVLLLLLWAFLPQQLNIALLPLILLIAFRSYLVSKNEDANKSV